MKNAFIKSFDSKPPFLVIPYNIKNVREQRREWLSMMVGDATGKLAIGSLSLALPTASCDQFAAKRFPWVTPSLPLGLRNAASPKESNGECARYCHFANCIVHVAQCLCARCHLIQCAQESELSISLVLVRKSGMWILTNRIALGPTWTSSHQDLVTRCSNGPDWYKTRTIRNLAAQGELDSGAEFAYDRTRSLLARPGSPTPYLPVQWTSLANECKFMARFYSKQFANAFSWQA